MRTPSAFGSLRLLALALLSVAPLASAAGADRPGASAPEAETFAVLKDGRKLPLFSEQSDATPIARVANDAVTLRELTEALSVSHGQHRASKGADQDFRAMLDRLIELHLVAVEAQAMGIQDMPEFKSQVAAMEEKILRDTLKEEAAAKVQLDPKEVERRYREASHEWKIRSVLFAKREDANAFDAARKGGASFESLAAKVVAEKKGRSSGDPAFLRDAAMSPAVRDAVRKLKKGVSGPIPVDKAFTIVQVLEERQADDPSTRASVEAGIRAEKRLTVLTEYYKKLTAKHAEVDRALLKRLDLEAPKPGLEALEKDGRALARIKGERPLTVGDLVVALRQKFFHGLERQAKEKKLNAQKQTTFDDLLQKRLFTKEARIQGLQDRADVKRRLKDYSDKMAVTVAIERVIVPEVKVTEDDLKKYYKAHKDEITTPAMVKLEALAFEKAADAQAAFKKLRSGTDFKWLAANSQGLLPPEKQAVQFDGTVTVSDLPPDIAAALAGSKTGDYRLYADARGQYVIHVIERFEPSVQPFEAVKEQLSARAKGEKLNAAFKEWAGKLRQSYPVEILIAKFGS